MVDRSLDDLHPNLEPLCKQFLAECAASNLKVIVTETWRNPVREDQLHAKGITKTTGKSCKHCFTLSGKPASKAFDFAILDENNRMIADGTDDSYSLAGLLGKKIGLSWGGDFTTTKDYDHMEIA